MTTLQQLVRAMDADPHNELIAGWLVVLLVAERGMSPTEAQRKIDNARAALRAAAVARHLVVHGQGVRLSETNDTTEGDKP